MVLRHFIRRLVPACIACASPLCAETLAHDEARGGGDVLPPRAPPGAAIYMTMGPSGAGKDTLLLGARARLAAEAAAAAHPGGVNREEEEEERPPALRRRQSVVFVKRHITRDASLCTDLEVRDQLERLPPTVTARSRCDAS